MTQKQQPWWYRRARFPFWNDQENRLRAFWRILGAVAVILVVTIVFNLVVIRSLNHPVAVLNLLSSGVAALVTILLVVLWARYVDRRPLRAYGFRLDRKWWYTLLLGGFVGLLGWGGSLATTLALGWASVSAIFSPGAGELPFLISVALFALGWVFVGFWEEVVFRGIVMRNAIEGLTFTSISYQMSVIAGWVVSSAVFGLLHLNQATSPVALIFWIIAGLVFGLAYLLTDQLAFPIGLHVGFDFSVNHVFGLASVRETGTDAPTIIRPEFTGPEMFVGLSGVVNTVWLIIIGLLTVVVINRLYGSVQPRIEPYPEQKS